MSSQKEQKESATTVKISDFLSGKPSIEPVQQSALLSRLRTFLPQMEQANQNIPSGASADAFQIIENVVEESSSDSSDSDDSDSEDNVVKGSESSESSPKNPESQKRIEIDLDVFREKNSTIDERDVSVQDVDSLPKAFQEDDVAPKKLLIEEL